MPSNIRRGGSRGRRGTAGLASAATVKEMCRRPAVNDSYCTGGRMHGELCGWRVTATGVDVYYGEDDAWVLNAV